MAEWLGLPSVESYKGLDLRSLPMNHAFVIANTSLDNLGVYVSRDDCYACPYKIAQRLKAGVETTWIVDTGVRTTWRIMRPGTEDSVAANNGNGLLCQLRSFSLGEFGVYRLNAGRCEITTELEPTNSYLPLLLCLAVITLIWILYATVKHLTSKKKRHNIYGEDLIPNPFSKREQAIQHFRGLLLYFIIFIETGGGGYPIFNIRNGCMSILDCLFFAYASTFGVNLPSKVDESLGKRRGKYSIIADICKRGVILVLLGTLIDSTVRNRVVGIKLWCPLQMLGAAYIFVGIVYVLTRKKFEIKSKRIFCKLVSNMVSLIWCWLLTGFLLMLMAVLISALLSFNCQSTTPSSLKGLNPFSPKRFPKSCDNAFTETVNQIFVGESKGLIAANEYFMFPAGVMGILSTIIHLMVGLKAGTVYLYHESDSDRLKLWAIWATLFGTFGTAIAALAFVMQFNLWPLSTQLLLSSAGLYSFSLIYAVTEIFSFQNSVISASGATSLVLMACHLLFSRTLPYILTFNYNTHLFYCIQNLSIVGVWSLVGLLFAKKNFVFSM